MQNCLSVSQSTCPYLRQTLMTLILQNSIVLLIGTKLKGSFLASIELTRLIENLNH